MKYVGYLFGFVAFQAGVLACMGQPWISASGIVKIWEGAVFSIENSQHLSDWYTFSHIIHGIVFYWLLQRFLPQLSLGARVCIALGAEVAWELVENSPMIIDRYRETALALGYSGDSIINSVSDTVAMCVGFFVARVLPAVGTVALVLLFEVGVGYMIRDNLTLNVLNLVYPFPSVQEWQAGK